MDALSRNRKRTGGLVLQRKELQDLLSQPDTLGLAFAVKKPGKAPDVDLTVMRVFEKEGILYGDEVTSEISKKGAPSPLRYPATSKEDYKFRFRKKLKEDKFAFGYFSKDAFEDLFRHEGYEEVFLGGGIKDYGDIDLIEGDQSQWFTLAISVRHKLTSVLSNNGSGAVSFHSNQAMEKHTLSLNEFSSEASVSLSALRKQFPDVFDQKAKVESLILEKGGTQIQGVVLQTSNGPQHIEFDSQRPVENVLLNLDGGIRKIHFQVEKEDEKENQAPEEELTALGNMFMGHFEPCPPYWYIDGKLAQTDIKSFLNSFLNDL